MSWLPAWLLSLLELIPVPHSKVFLLFKSVDKNDEKVLVVEQGREQ